MLMISLPMMRRKKVQEVGDNLEDDPISINQTQAQFLSEEDDKSNQDVQKPDAVRDPTYVEALFDYRTLLLWIIVI